MEAKDIAAAEADERGSGGEGKDYGFLPLINANQLRVVSYDDMAHQGQRTVEKRDEEFKLPPIN